MPPSAPCHPQTASTDATTSPIRPWPAGPPSTPCYHLRQLRPMAAPALSVPGPPDRPHLPATPSDSFDRWQHQPRPSPASQTAREERKNLHQWRHCRISARPACHCFGTGPVKRGAPMSTARLDRPTAGRWFWWRPCRVRWISRALADSLHRVCFH